MGEMMFEVKIECVGEVRDAEGNLISSSPVTLTEHLTESQLRAKGLTEEQITEIREQA